MRALFRMLIPAAALALACCESRNEQLSWELVEVHPHQVDCYTQGLEFHGDVLLESGGLYGESKLRRVDPDTGEVLQGRSLPASVFAEGLTVVGDELWLLTWESEKAYVFDRDSFDLKRTHRYEGEGWGICYDGKQLIMSDGSSELTLRDPENFKVLGKLEVTRDGKPQLDLNELEYVDGVIYANIYESDEIVRIDANSGKITAVLDLSALREKLGNEGKGAEVLNGIARNPETGHLWVTGKHWSNVFEIRLK